MGRASRRRSSPPPEAAGAAPPRRPWYANPWKAGLVGALVCGGIAAIRVACAVAGPRAEVTAPAARDAGPLVVAEAEPNDTPAQAQALARLPAEVAGTLTAGDRDYYRVTVAAPGTQLVDAWVDESAGARVRVLAADGRELMAADAPARIGALGVTQGAYLVAVEGGAAAVVGAYRLHVVLSPWTKGLDWEPDDDADHAQTMATLATGKGENARHGAAGWWSRPGDVDCFTAPLVVPAEGAMLRVELRPPPGVRPRLWVLDAGNAEAKVPRRTLVDVTAPAAGQPALVPALGARSWEAAYVVCTTAAEGANPAGRYQLDVRSFTPPGPFEFEPNGTRETATALPREVAVGGHLTAGDVDWFRVSAGGTGPVAVTLQVPAGVQAELALLDDRGRTLARGDGAGPASVTVTYAAPAFVRLTATSGENLKDTYRVIARTVKGAP
ncbi:MAG TPA: hypothetical protein VGQ83_09600 [Polyangia bacterium]|jgi:hypothetical protein